MTKKRNVTASVARPIMPLNDLRTGSMSPLFALLLIAGGYAIAFYVVRLERLAYWRMLLLPDEIWNTWTAGTGIFAIADRLGLWLVAAWYLAACYSAGSGTLRLLRLSSPTLERFVIALSLGLALCSTGTLLVGLAGGLHAAWLFRGLAIALPLLEFAAVYRTRSLNKEGAAAIDKTGSPFHQEHVFAMSALGLLTLIYLVASSTPPTDFDVREYHLQVPKEWFLAGRIEFLPHNVYGNMPLGAEMHALACMELWPGSDAWWHGAIIGKVIVGLIAPLTALVIVAAAGRFYSTSAGLLGAIAYLTFPWIAHVSFNALNDGVLGHFVLLTLYAALLCRAHRRWCIAAGLFAGAAAAVKYPGLVFALPTAVLAVGFSSWQRRPVARVGCTIVAMLLLLAGFAVTAAPWYVKNTVLTGNPVYPLAARWLAGETRSPERIAQWERAHQVPRDAAGNRYAPGQIANGLRQVMLGSEWLGMLIWPLSAIGVAATWRRRETKVLMLSASWILLVWFTATHRIDRFWLPAVPLAALLAGAAWQASHAASYRRPLLAFACWGALSGLLMLLTPLVIDQQVRTISNPYWLLSLDQLRREQQPESHRQINALVASDDAVLLVGDAEPFDLQPNAFYNTCFDASLLQQWVEGRTADEIRQAFAERRITHVLVDWSELQRYRSSGNYGYTPFVQPAVFAELVAKGILAPPLREATQELHPAWEIYPVRLAPRPHDDPAALKPRGDSRILTP